LETTAKKEVTTFQKAMTENVVSCAKKNMTPSVAAPFDTNPSDATAARQRAWVAVSLLFCLSRETKVRSLPTPLYLSYRRGYK